MAAAIQQQSIQTCSTKQPSSKFLVAMLKTMVFLFPDVIFPGKWCTAILSLFYSFFAISALQCAS